MPHKHNFDKKCRFKCNSEEDIIHISECVNDKIPNKIFKREDLNNIINDNCNIQFKYKLKDLKRILNSRRSLLKSHSYERGIS